MCWVESGYGGGGASGTREEGVPAAITVDNDAAVVDNVVELHDVDPDNDDDVKLADGDDDVTDEVIDGDDSMSECECCAPQPNS